jgi:predicted transcriptional regulator
MYKTSYRNVYDHSAKQRFTLRETIEVLPVQAFVIHNNTCYRSGMMSNTEKTISFRAVAEKIDTLDALAAAQDRSRSYLINEAITNYIDLHAYQDALVRKGIEEMRKGRVVRHEDVVKRLKRTGRAR